MKYKRATFRSFDERFRDSGEVLHFTLGDFWQWSASDLVSNALRGVLAEFLVAKATGCADSDCRVEWGFCDLTSPSGVKIEVKTSGYVQSWAQKRDSVPNFDIGRKRGWDAETNTSATEPSRAADVYVFALHSHRDRDTIDPLDVAQWRFFVLRTNVLDSQCEGQKRIGLARLRALESREVAFKDLKAAIDAEAERRSQELKQAV